jgi:putative IMPACT (imprinted ancient) family translation regulator
VWLSRSCVRYYGGVNLGAGGLVRAYGGVASDTLRMAEKTEIHSRVALLITVKFEQMNALYRLLEGYDLQGREEHFTADGLELRADFVETDVARVRLAVRDATRGLGAVSEARED